MHCSSQVTQQGPCRADAELGQMSVTVVKVWQGKQGLPMGSKQKLKP